MVYLPKGSPDLRCFFSICFGGPVILSTFVFEKVYLIIVNSNLGNFLMTCLKFSSWWFQHV